MRSARLLHLTCSPRRGGDRRTRFARGRSRWAWRAWRPRSSPCSSAWRHSGAAPSLDSPTFACGNRGVLFRSGPPAARCCGAAAVVGARPSPDCSIRSFTALLRLDLRLRSRGRRAAMFNLGFSEEKHDTKEKQWALVDAWRWTAHGCCREPLPRGPVLQRPFVYGRHWHGHRRHHRGAAARRPERRQPQPVTQLGKRHTRTISAPWTSGCCRAGSSTSATAQSPPVVIIGQLLAAAAAGRARSDCRRNARIRRAGRRGQARRQTVVGVVEGARIGEPKRSRFDLYLLDPARCLNQVQHFMVRLSGDRLRRSRR